MGAASRQRVSIAARDERGAERARRRANGRREPTASEHRSEGRARSGASAEASELGNGPQERSWQRVVAKWQLGWSDGAGVDVVEARSALLAGRLDEAWQGFVLA